MIQLVQSSATPRYSSRCFLVELVLERASWLRVRCADGRDVRHNTKALGADPGENDLGRCCSQTLRRCNDGFVNRATGVAGNRTNEIPGQRFRSTKENPDAREATVSFKKDVVFGSELDQVLVLVVVVRVKEDLLEVRTRALDLAGGLVPGLQWG